MVWSKSSFVENNVQSFTIREIDATIKACSKGENLKHCSQIIYDTRYPKSKQKELDKILNKYSYLKKWLIFQLIFQIYLKINL